MFLPFFLFKYFLRRYIHTYIHIQNSLLVFVFVSSFSSIRRRRLVFVASSSSSSLRSSTSLRLCRHFIFVFASSLSRLSSFSSSLGARYCTVDRKSFFIVYGVALTLQPAKDLSNILTLVEC